MINYSITANDMMKEGFKMSFKAENADEIKVCQSLTEKLIEKISVIEIKQSMDNGEEY